MPLGSSCPACQHRPSSAACGPRPPVHWSTRSLPLLRGSPYKHHGQSPGLSLRSLHGHCSPTYIYYVYKSTVTCVLSMCPREYSPLINTAHLHTCTYIHVHVYIRTNTDTTVCTHVRTYVRMFTEPLMEQVQPYILCAVWYSTFVGAHALNRGHYNPQQATTKACVHGSVLPHLCINALKVELFLKIRYL